MAAFRTQDKPGSGDEDLVPLCDLIHQAHGPIRSVPLASFRCDTFDTGQELDGFLAFIPNRARQPCLTCPVRRRAGVVSRSFKGRLPRQMIAARGWLAAAAHLRHHRELTQLDGGSGTGSAQPLHTRCMACRQPVIGRGLGCHRGLPAAAARRGPPRPASDTSGTACCLATAFRSPGSMSEYFAEYARLALIQH